MSGHRDFVFATLYKYKNGIGWKYYTQRCSQTWIKAQNDTKFALHKTGICKSTKFVCDLCIHIVTHHYTILVTLFRSTRPFLVFIHRGINSGENILLILRNFKSCLVLTIIHRLNRVIFQFKLQRSNPKRKSLYVILLISRKVNY